MHGSRARFLSAVHTESWKLKWDNCNLSCADTGRATVCYRADQNPHNTSEQQCIGSRSSSYSYSTEYDNSTSRHPNRSHSQTPKHFGKDIIPSIFDGKQRTDFREWAENSAVYQSTQCVDACEILLEWLVMEKEHVAEAATGTARKIATSGKRGDGLNAWRRLFQEYNPQLVTGAQALLRRALSMGRAKGVADVSDRIQELEELVRKYEEHEGCTFSAAFKIPEINGHPPPRRRKAVDSGIHEHKAKLRVAQEQSVSVGAVESQRQVCNGLLARW